MIATPEQLRDAARRSVADLDRETRRGQWADALATAQFIVRRLKLANVKEAKTRRES